MTGLCGGKIANCLGLLPVAASLATAGIAPLAAQEGKRAEPPVTVGANVRISGSYGERPHNEVIAAADPANAGRMIACAMVSYEDLDLIAQHCYSTFDGGTSWEPTLIIDDAGWPATHGLLRLRGHRLHRGPRHPL